MLRKIFFIATILIFGAILYAVYYYYGMLSRPASSGLDAVPLNAVAVIESRDPLAAWKKLHDNRLFWEHLQATGFFRETDKNVSFLDSIISSDKSLNELAHYQPAIISLHRSGAREFNFLFILPVPPLFNNIYLENAIERIAGAGCEKSSRKYDDAEITEISCPAKKCVFASSFIKNFFICSFSPLLVEDAIRQSTGNNTITALPEFGSLHKTADKKADANLYVNYGTLPELLSLFFKPEFLDGIRKIKDFANWSESDITFEKENVILNGFSFYMDLQGKMTAMFSEGKPSAMEVETILPDNTAVCFYYWLAGTAPVQQSFMNYLSATGQLAEYENKMKTICDKTGDSPEKLLSPLLDEELAYFVTCPDSGNITFNRYIALKTSSPEVAVEKLSFISHVMAGTNDTLAADEPYKDFMIKNFAAKPFLEILPCNLFEIPASSFYVLIDEYLVFGFSRQSLCRIIDRYLSGKTLHNNANFIAFSERQSSSPAMNIFVNLRYAGKTAGSYLDEKKALSIMPFFKDWKQEQQGMLSLQFFSGKNLVFTNILAGVFENKESTVEDNMIKWVAHTDTVFNGKPFLLLNHTTKSRDVFLQDEGNTVYLLDNTGTILWKKRLNEKIISEIVQVDALKNNKLQMLFNTAHKIYLVDRKGRDVSPFPVQLPEKATNGISVFDYDRNRTYRIIVACSDRNIYCFDLNGKKVEGWNFKGSAGTINLPVKHFSLKEKDYIVAIDTMGNIYVVDRKGENRIALKTRLPVSPRNTYYLDIAGDIGKSRIIATDSTGTVHSVYFNDRHDTASFETFSSEHFFNFSDLDGDGEKDYIFLDKDMLQVFRQDHSQMFIYTFNRFVNFAPVVFELQGKNPFLGVAVDKTGELFLFKPDGSLCTGFPLAGNTRFAIGDINNNGTIHLISGAADGITDYELGKGFEKIK